MEQYKIENGIAYEFRGEQYYPVFALPEETHYPIGKYGDLHLEFIKKHRKGTYSTLLTQFKLNEHLHTVDVQAKKQVRMMTAQLAQSRGINEALKATNPLEWTAQMNAAKHDAEEIVVREVVYQ